MFAGKPRELARGVLLARIVLEHLLEMSSPGAEHLDRGLHNYPCASLKLVSPDVLVIPSWYHTLLFRQYPGYCTNGISARNQTLHRTIELRS